MSQIAAGRSPGAAISGGSGRARELSLLQSHDIAEQADDYGPVNIASRLHWLRRPVRSAIDIRACRLAMERRRNEQPGADQQTEGDAANDRENVVPAISRFGPRGGLLRR